MTAPPTWATTPDPNAANDLVQIRRVAAMLGTPLMPWQELAARIASERRPDGSWRYPTMVVTVPRQSGKTTLLRAIMTQRAMTSPDYLAFYTAQTGKDAVARWKDLTKVVAKNPILASYAKVREAAGSPSLTFTRTGSVIAPFAPTDTALHGYTPPFVGIDESFSFTEDEGTKLMGAIMPAQATLTQRQLWLISTKGPAESTWFRSWVEAGRAATLDPAATIGHVEYCAADGADLYSPDTWATYHPALGHTINVDTLVEQSLHCPPGEWARAYGNVFTQTSEAILNLTAWDSLAGPPAVFEWPAGGRVGIGYDVHSDRSHASIFAAWLDGDDVAHVRTIASAPGLEWVADRVGAVLELLGDRATATAHDDGPTRQVTELLEAAGRRVTRVTGKDYTTACGALLWRANTRRLVHDGSANLRDAWRDAQHRPSGEGWGFIRHLSAGPIDALIAATLATRAATIAPAVVQPEMWF